MPSPCTETFHASKARAAGSTLRRTSSPQHTHHSCTQTLSSRCLGLKGISSRLVIFSHSERQLQTNQRPQKSKWKGINCSLLTSGFQTCSRGSRGAELRLFSPLLRPRAKSVCQGQRGRTAGEQPQPCKNGRATSALQKRDSLMKILTEPDTVAERCKENLHNIR